MDARLILAHVDEEGRGKLYPYLARHLNTLLELDPEPFVDLYLAYKIIWEVRLMAPASMPGDILDMMDDAHVLLEMGSSVYSRQRSERRDQILKNPEVYMDRVELCQTLRDRRKDRYERLVAALFDSD